MRRFLHENGLSIAMLALFALFLVGQALTGYQEFNSDQREHAQAVLTFAQYLGSGAFLESVFENWESEFLQMGMYVILTSFLFQRGSAESKSLEGSNDVDRDVGDLSPRELRDAPKPIWRGGWALKLYRHSLGLALILLFLASFFLHAASGAREYNQEQAEHGQRATLSMWQYMTTSRFWFESFQNWQSEFLAVFTIIVLSIFLRQKGSPESKPVAAPHDEEAA